MGKKIRFVVDGSPSQFHDIPSANSGQASNVVHRQKRTSRACTNCKKRKVRCSGTNPCAVCSSRNIECAYKDNQELANPPAKRRKFDKSESTTISRLNVSPNESKNPSAEAQVITRKTFPSTASARELQVTDNLSSLAGSTDFIVSNVDKENTSPVIANEPLNPVVLTRQPYFRWLGPTSVAPPLSGIFRLLSVNISSSAEEQPTSLTTPSSHVIIGKHEFKLQVAAEGLETDCIESAISTPLPKSSHSQEVGTQCQVADRMWWKIGIPCKAAIDTFYEHMASYLPFLRRKDLDDRVSAGVAGECLLYAMAAIAERLKPSQSGSDGGYVSEMYAERAKMLLIPHLALPSVETVFALLLIAYHEFAVDRDSGLWSWSGLAIRMSYDLGLHKSSDGIGDAEQNAQRRRVFWSVVCLDRFISCGTGRVATIPIEHIEHEVGEPATGEVIRDIDGKSLTDPFSYLCRLVVLLGRVSDTLNQYAGEEQHVSSQSSNRSDLAANNVIQTALSGFQKEISDFHASLPADLVFNVHNFQAFARTNHAQCFLLMHAWNHAIILAVYHPKLVYPRSSLDIPGWLSNSNSDLSRTSAISIADMIAFADLIAPDAFLSNPFMCQPLLMAGCASLILWHSLTLASLHTNHAAASTVHRAFSACQDGLNRLQQRWKGVSWLCQVLDSLEKFEPDVDLTQASDPEIKTKDMGFAKRASIDEATRQWIADELGGDSILGVVIAGTATETARHNFPPKTKRVLKTANIPSIGSLLENDTPVAEQNDICERVSSSSLIPLPLQHQQRIWTPDASSLLEEIDDPFKSLVADNMSLDEFLRGSNL